MYNVYCMYLDHYLHHAHNNKQPCLSTDANCWPLDPPRSHATETTPLLWPFSCFSKLPSVVRQMKISPVDDPAAANCPVVRCTSSDCQNIFLIKFFQLKKAKPRGKNLPSNFRKCCKSLPFGEIVHPAYIKSILNSEW